jgi:hypothetical protein
MPIDPLAYLGTPDASTTVSGKARIATVAESVAGTRQDIVCSPAGVAAVAISGSPAWSESTSGIGKLATNAQAVAGTNDDRAMTPLKTSAVFAAPPAIGGVTPAAGTFTTLTADSTGAIGLDADAASHFAVSGAGIDLTLQSSLGRVIVNGEEAAANAITLLSAAGGIDADAALQINIASSQNAADAIVISASAGGIDLTAAGAAGEDIDLVCTAGSINLTAGENAADSIKIVSSVGGIDITCSGAAAGEDIDITTSGSSVNITASEDAVDAIKLTASAGGIQLLATGEATQDITITNTGGSVQITATENVSDAIYLRANGGTSEAIKIHADQGTGVASVNILSDVGGITLTSTGLASADAINLEAAAGGIDMDAALQINIASSQNAANSIVINSSAGGIDITCSSAAAGEDLDLVATGSSVNVSSSEAVSDAITLQASAGGIDMDGALQVSMRSSQNAANSIVIESTAGGVDLLASGASAGEDIDIVATGSSVNIQATEAVSDAITLNASNAAGGMTLASGSNGLLLDTSGVLELNSSAAAIGIGNDAVAQAINVGTGAAARTVTVGNTTGASALVLKAGTGKITMTGTIQEATTNFVTSTGDSITFAQSPVLQSNLTTGAAPTGVAGDVNLMSIGNGIIMEQFIIGTQTIIAPRMSSSGLLVSLDLTATDGVEYNWGAARNNSRNSFTIGTSAAFFFEVQMTIADISGGSPYCIGFRKTEANNATFANYTDYAAIGMFTLTSATNIVLCTELNSGGQTLTNTTDAWGGDGATKTLKVLVSAAGVVTYTINGAAPTSTAAFTFDSTDVVAPFIRIEHGAVAPGAVNIVSMKCGFQA